MKFMHPETKEIFEVPDAHGQTLLEQGFYKRVEDTVEVRRKPGRPRKNEQVNGD